MTKEEERKKVAFWNEWFRKDKQLLDLAEEGCFDLDMAFIRPNDLEHIKEVCTGKEGQFADLEDFMSSLFWLKEDHRGDFWKVEDDWFVIDTNEYPVSDETVDGMIQYILENSSMGVEEAHDIQKRFNADYDKEKADYDKEKAAYPWIPFDADFDEHGNMVAVNTDHDETDKELPEGLSPREFYETYIRDNPVFTGMPDECWIFVQQFIKTIYQEALCLRGDKWGAVEAAVRRLLNRNGLDGESW